MNLLEDSLESFSDSIKSQNSKYIQEHVSNVILGYTYIYNRLPELIDDLEISKEEFRHQIMKHDASKWSEEEFMPYAEHFFGSKKGSTDEEDPAFKEAWKHHYMNNPHHPEFWGKDKDMPNSCLLEMLCDLWSFGWKSGKLKEIFSYWEKNREKKKEHMSENSMKKFEEYLEKLKEKLDEDSETILTESFAGDRAYKEGLEAAVNAVIASRARHWAMNDFNKEKDPAIKRKYLYIARKLGDEKDKNLINLVSAADDSEGRISVDITNDKGNTKSITAEFDGKFHMSLHNIKGSTYLLDQDRKGAHGSTGYGENPRFIKAATGKDSKALTQKKYEKEKKMVGLLEQLIEKDDISKESLFKMWEERYYAIMCLSGDARNICLNAVASDYFSEFDDDKDYIPEIGPGQKYHEKAIRKYLRDIEKLKIEAAAKIAKKEDSAICEYILDAIKELDNKGYILELGKELHKNLTEAHRDDPEVIELANEIKADVKRLNDLGINTGPVDHLDLNYIPEKKVNESEFSDDLVNIFGDAFEESDKDLLTEANLVVKLSKREYENLFNIPLSRLMTYNLADIKKEIIEKENGKSIRDYQLDPLHRGLTINTIKSIVNAKGSIDDKEFVKERCERLQKLVDKAKSKDLDSIEVTYSQINGLLSLYKRATKKRNMKFL